MKAAFGLALAALLAVGCAATAPVVAPAAAAGGEGFDEDRPPEEELDEDGRGVIATTLLYVPNRVFDVLDIVRARLRLGAGFGAGVRVTELADATFGGWATVFVGLRGPRGEPRIPWPFGLETYAGAELSILDVSTEEGGAGPGYGPGEVGLGLHLLLIGAEVGVEPLELLDLLAGLALYDPCGDDL